jgi:SAM-dependent methyltransferase
MSRHDGDQAPSAQSRAASWDERHTAHDPIESRDPDPTLIAEVASLTPGKALDLGSGDGRNAVWLARQGWAVTGVDFSVVALDRARALAATAAVAVDWVQADLLSWTPPADAFDLVAVFFIHLPSDERRSVYAKAAAAVAIGGTLLIVGHDRSNAADGVGGPRDPDVLFTPDEVAAGLPDGFAIERAAVVRRESPEEPAPIDAVVRAVRWS